MPMRTLFPVVMSLTFLVNIYSKGSLLFHHDIPEVVISSRSSSNPFLLLSSSNFTKKTNWRLQIACY
ncbi:unnamed protein product [Larinioides sclopetarius]|uniref:Uncharacterized protein n=1 Tax=Larinioides sclopetarius TaxID=280406 RepID=A0AAV1Z8P6_9ARAC